MEVVTPEPENPWPLFPNQTVQASPLEVGAGPGLGAGFWRRTLAFLIDLILLEWITLLFLWIGSAAEDMAQAHLLGGLLSDPIEEWTSVYTPLSNLLFVIYFSFFTFYGGQTPGKMALRIRVMGLDSRTIPWHRAALRTLAYYLDFLTLGFGFLMAAIPPSKRALHDRLSGTVVAKVPPK